VYKLIAKSTQCQLTALATAVLLSLASTPANALSLGRITVQSTLGEPLKAQVDFLDINAEEAATVSARIASPEAFKAAGLDYNAALSSLRATLQRRSDGRAYLQLTSDHIVNEPFIDVILETSWNSGRIVRDYTLLFDPPSQVIAKSQAPDATQLASQTVISTAPPAAGKSQPSVANTAQAAVTSKQAAIASRQAAAAAKQPTTPESVKTVRVQPGQTAGEIAVTYHPANVSLDQMLVAMLRANPDAFIENNVNRIRAGAVIALPSEQAAKATGTDEAARIVIAQSRDFDEFRRKLASNVARTADAPSAREASGQVQALVQERKAAPVTPDKLTLSKGSVQAKSGEDQLASARNAQQAQARAAELAKNISDLKQLAAAASAPAKAVEPPPAARAASAPVPSVSNPVTVTAPAIAPAAVTRPLPAPASKPAAVEPVAQAESGLLADVLAEPLLPAGVVALLALLAAWGVYKRKQSQKSTAVDSSFTEVKPSETLTNASGGQVIDTSTGLASGASMVYSPSQLDAADDVDPVAEADVYLAYGRDLQAEEILKDALRNTPERVAIHAKLAEIYAKRQDVKALEAIATQAFNLTNGSGPQWDQICEKGLSIDPDNALYLPGGQPSFVSDATVVMDARSNLAATTGADDVAAAKAAADAVTSRAGALEDLDLDLDFSLEEPSDLPDLTPPAPVQIPPTRPVALESSPISGLVANTMPGGLDFTTEPAPFDPVSKLAALHEELPDVVAPTAQTVSMGAYDPDKTMVFDRQASWPNPPATPTAAEAPATSEVPLMPEFEPEPSQPQPPERSLPSEPQMTLAEEVAPVAEAPKDMLSFDIDSLSLELADDKTPTPEVADEPAMDPLETKLALAEEFRAIGDDDGARALIEEVVSEATGELKVKAQQALGKL